MKHRPERDEILWSWWTRRFETPWELDEAHEDLLHIFAREPNKEISGTWLTLIERLDGMNNLIFELGIRFSRAEMVVTGSVISEGARIQIIETLNRYQQESPNLIKGFEIIDEIEVTAPFHPAQDVEYGSHMSDIAMDSALIRPESSPSEKIAVDRYPTISADQLPVAGASFRFEVDLKSEPDATTDTEPVSFEDVSGDWRSLEVEVEVHSSRLVFKEGENRKTITVLREGMTLPASFSAIVSESIGSASQLEVLAIFTYRDRFSGMVRRLFEVQRPPVTIPEAAASGSAGIVSLVTADAADLTVKIIRLDGEGNYLWSLHAPDGRSLGSPSREAPMNLGRSTAEYAAGLLKECPQLDSSRHASVLRGIGERIWLASPEAFRFLYRDLHDKFGPAFAIQIITDEPHIPWEMMHPDDDAGVHKPDHLFMTHPIARWFVQSDGRMPASFESGSIASFVPVYKNGNSLPAALDEGVWLQKELGALPQNATCKHLTEFWGAKVPDEPVAVLHFAGHGDIDPAGVARIELLDGWVDCNEVHSGVMLGRRYGTFVVLNACKTGVAEHQLGLASGWAASLTGRGFGGVLAPIWAVQDECASNVVRDYLRAFTAGTPLGRAMLVARSARRQDSSTPYAYVAHGDVMAKMKQESA